MSSMSSLIILPILALILFFFFRKNKSGGDKTVLNNRANRKDEVWRTIKSFLKENHEFGKEIVWSFVAKRPNVLNKSATKKKFYQELDATIKAKKMTSKEARNYRRQMQKEQNRELYCVLFVTRNPKTHVTDPQRIIEAEVKYNVVKKERKREIKINGLMDFEKEYEWMKPLKEKEDKITAKVRRRKQIQEAKRANAKRRKNERAMRKQNRKHLQSNN